MGIEEHRLAAGDSLAHDLEHSLRDLAVTCGTVHEGRPPERGADAREERLAEGRPAQHVNDRDARIRHGNGLREAHHALRSGRIVHARCNMPEGAGTHVARVTGAATGGPRAPGHPIAFRGMGLLKRFLVVVVGVPGSPAEAQRSEVGRFRTRSAAEQAGFDEWRRILFVHAPHVDRYRIVIEDGGVEVADIPMPELPAETAPGILDETVTPLGASMGAVGEPVDGAPAPKPAPEPEREPEPAANAGAEPTGGEPSPGAVADDVVVAAAPDAADPVREQAPEAIDATGELEVIIDDRPVDDLATTGEHKGLAHDIAATGEVPAVVEPSGDAPADDPPARASILIEDPPDGPVPDDIIERFAQMVKAEEEREAERSARERDGRG